MPIDADHPLLKRLHQLRYGDRRPDEVFFIVFEREIIATLELNDRLYAENERFKILKNLSRFQSYLESLESRISQLEDKQG